jgi:hypothetical protein
MGLEALWSVLEGAVVIMITAVGGSLAFKLAGAPMDSAPRSAYAFRVPKQQAFSPRNLNFLARCLS